MRRLVAVGGLLLAAGLAGAGELRDPTRPYPGDRWFRLPEAQRFTATRISTDGRRALIDGRWLGVGDRVGGFRVLAIRHGEVVLEGHGGRWVIRLVGSRGIREQEQ